MSPDLETTIEMKSSDKVQDEFSFKDKIMSPEEAMKPPMINAPGVSDIKEQIEAIMDDAERVEFQKFAASEQKNVEKGMKNALPDAKHSTSHAAGSQTQKEVRLSSMSPEHRNELEALTASIKKEIAAVAPTGATTRQPMDTEAYEEAVLAAASDPSIKSEGRAAQGARFRENFRQAIKAVLHFITLGLFPR